MSISRMKDSAGTTHDIIAGGITYATCGTAAGTAAKAATVSAGVFNLFTGAKVTVKFTYANTVEKPTLNVASTGAKAIYWHGAALASSQYWAAGAVLDFVYDGSYWNLVGVAKDNNTTYTIPTSLKNPHPLTIKGAGTTVKTYDGSAAVSVDWVAGSNVTITPDATNGKITIAATNTVYTHPSYTARTGKPTGNQAPAFGGTATVSQVTSDATGHVTNMTDRTITIPSTLSNGTSTAGLIKTTSTVTSNSGYTACPVISGVPYYKDTNNTYSLSSFGITSTATELNYTDGVTSNIQTQLNNKLGKTTYEYNTELALGQSGKVCIGKFPMYDSNVSVEIKSTTNTPYNGTLVIATQNINTTGGGTYTAKVYGDADNSLTNSIKIQYLSGSNVFSVYIDLPGWSKNLLHIQCVALKAEPTDIATVVTEIPSTATIVPTNALKAQFDNKANSSHGTHVTYSTTVPAAAGTASVGTASTVSRSDHVHPVQTSVSGNAGSANKVNNSLSIQLNGGTATTFDGSAAKSINITPSAIGAAAASHGTHLTIGTTSTTAAAGNHTHSGYVPTSRTVNSKALSANITLTASDVGAAASDHTHDYAASSHNHAASNITSGTLGVARGGTGKASWTANRLVYPSASTTMTQLAFPTTAGSFLRQGTSGAPYWSTPAETLSAIGAAASGHTHSGYAPAYTYSTTDLTAGTSSLETGKLYFVYE